MSLETQPRRAAAPASALSLLLAGVLAGAAGGALLVGLLPGFSQQKQLPDANLASGNPDNRGNPDQPAIREGTTGQGTGSTGRDGTVEIPAANADTDTAATPDDPMASEALRAILERRAAEEARLRERAQLASESPLTPPVTDPAEHIRARQETENARPGPDRPDREDGNTDLLADGPAVRPAPPVQGTASPVAPAAPAHVLARGSVIPAVLETALDSDLPGLVRARVSGDVYDSLTGSHVLIPRGAQLVGTYGETTRGGQRRLFVAWTDLRLPDGAPVDLQEFSTLGADGAAGVKGRRSTGLLAALGAAVLFDLVGNATQILTGTETPQQTDLAALIAGATGNATSRVAERYMGDLIDRGSRFRVKAGTIMNVLVEEDMNLPAQEGGAR